MKPTNDDFPYRSMRQILILLDCSKTYLYKMIAQGRITPYYFEPDCRGKTKGKPYFNIVEIKETLADSSSDNETGKDEKETARS